MTSGQLTSRSYFVKMDPIDPNLLKILNRTPEEEEELWKRHRELKKIEEDVAGFEEPNCVIGMTSEGKFAVYVPNNGGFSSNSDEDTNGGTTSNDASQSTQEILVPKNSVREFLDLKERLEKKSQQDEELSREKAKPLAGKIVRITPISTGGYSGTGSSFEGRTFRVEELELLSGPHEKKGKMGRGKREVHTYAIKKVVEASSSESLLKQWYGN